MGAAKNGVQSLLLAVRILAAENNGLHSSAKTQETLPASFMGGRAVAAFSSVDKALSAPIGGNVCHFLLRFTRMFSVDEKLFL